MSELIGKTESLCPVCLKTIPAEKIAESDKVYLVKTCPEHGTYKVLIWRGVTDYKDLERYSCVKSKPERIAIQNKGMCPEVCGLCPDHVQHTCLVVLEVTNGCNLRCPICFASANERYRFHPSLDEIEKMFRYIIEYVKHPIAVQISGGEPTIRDDLPEIVKIGKKMGVDYIEINTNGIRLAEDISYLRAIKEAGVDSLYFSFDGVTGDVFVKTCGRDLLVTKVKALENCKEVGMGVTLVTVVSRDINFHQIGDVIQFAKKWIPTVKGVHFQPLSYFGRYPSAPGEEDHVVLPDLLRAIEEQTKGELRADNFIPTSCANVHCDAKSMSVLLEDGTLFPLTQRALGPPRETSEIARKTRQEICDLWRYIEDSLASSSEEDLDGTWMGFIQRAKTHYLTVSTMPFQDVWNVETERLKNCCIHTVTPDGRLIPFCLFNINSITGKTLYRHEIFSKYGKG